MSNAKNTKLAIGDLHGQNFPELMDRSESLKNDFENAKRVIFVGDYFDSFDVSTPDMKKAFEDLIKLKEQYPEKVILLIGNHDFHYLNQAKVKCTGYRKELQVYAGELVDKYIRNKFLKFIHIEDEFIFSHAGISKVWLTRFFESDSRFPKETILENFDDFAMKDGSRIDYAGPSSGMKSEAGPLWIRPYYLAENNAFPNRIQVFGHTATDGVETYGEEKRLISIDCFRKECSFKYLKIEEFDDSLKWSEVNIVI